jgi:hypothetical protein
VVALGTLCNQSAICWLRRGLGFRLAICFIQHFDGAIHNLLLIPVDAFEACCDPAVGIMLACHRRRVVHFNVTEHPTAAWTAQQIVDAFPDDSAPSYLLRDRDQVYGEPFRHRVRLRRDRSVAI